MTELLDVAASPWSLVLVLIVFGFAPGACLRLIVLLYPRGHPRRAELIAELYTVPRVERPLWVAEQLEVALFEGLPNHVSATLRWSARLRPRVVARYVAGGVLVLIGTFVGGSALTAVVVIGNATGFVPLLVLVLVLGSAIAFAIGIGNRTTFTRQLRRSRNSQERSDQRPHGQCPHLQPCQPRCTSSHSDGSPTRSASAPTASTSDVGR